MIVQEMGYVIIMENVVVSLVGLVLLVKVKSYAQEIALLLIMVSVR